MSDDKAHADNESIMIALDQISQTIEVMTKVVQHLRVQLENQQRAQNSTQAEAEAKNQTLH